MNSLTIASSAERSAACEQLYQDHISPAIERMAVYQFYATVHRWVLPVGCATNLRDALFHFRKMSVSESVEDIMTQSFAAKEHLSRAVADASNKLMEEFSQIAGFMLKSKALAEDKRKTVRRFLHEFKQRNLISRMRGMMIVEIAAFLQADTKQDEMFESFLTLINDDPQLLELYEEYRAKM